jgi:hypothetical protein
MYMIMNHSGYFVLETFLNLFPFFWIGVLLCPLTFEHGARISSTYYDLSLTLELL